MTNIIHKTIWFMKAFIESRSKIQLVDMFTGMMLHGAFFAMFILLTRESLTGADEILMLMIVFLYVMVSRDPGWFDD